MSKENNLTPVAFKFNATHQEIRSFLINKEPWFVAKDVCDILGLSNSRVATSILDEDEKADVSISYTSSNGITQDRKVKTVSESGLYALILRSNKKEARTFRKWITADVLPSIRKKGYYTTNAYAVGSYIDARDIPYTSHSFNNALVRKIVLQDQEWFSITDIHKCMGSNTCATQAVKKLNAKQTLAKKVWLFGGTHPTWFTSQLGFSLLLSSSKMYSQTTLNLPLC